MSNTVATTRIAPDARNVYYTGPKGRGRYPTGTWLRTLPDPVGLTGLAAFLAEHVYNTSRHRGALQVRVYDDLRTQADIQRAAIRHEGGRWQYGGGAGWFSGPEAEHKCRALVENIIRCYALDREVAAINDWLFPLAWPNETAEQFWTRAADELLASGATRVAVCAPLRARVEFTVR